MIPALPDASADTVPEETRLSLRYSQYREDDLGRQQTFNTDRTRMEVDVAQFHLSTPLGENWALLLDIDHEDVSGASPWFVGLDDAGSPRVVLSGASIRDTRTGVSVTTRYYLPDGSTGFNYSGSREDDYESHALGIDRSWSRDDAQATYSLAGSYAEDRLSPTQGSTATDVLRAERDTSSLWGRCQLHRQPPAHHPHRPQFHLPGRLSHRSIQGRRSPALQPAGVGAVRRAALPPPGRPRLGRDRLSLFQRRLGRAVARAGIHLASGNRHAPAAGASFALLQPVGGGLFLGGGKPRAALLRG